MADMPEMDERDHQVAKGCQDLPRPSVHVRSVVEWSSRKTASRIQNKLSIRQCACQA
jgi:hypothetical protein